MNYYNVSKATLYQTDSILDEKTCSNISNMLSKTIDIDLSYIIDKNILDILVVCIDGIIENINESNCESKYKSINKNNTIKLLNDVLYE